MKPTRAGGLHVERTMTRAAVTMTEAVQAGFRGAVKSLESELQVMPLSRWNESVLRYYFCRSIATAHPDAEQFVECGKIDLVLAQAGLRAFVEFKFYWKPRRFDPYGHAQPGFKGGPSLKNLGEFRACIDQLAERPPAPGLSKYVVLVYADRTDEGRPKPRFSDHYDKYQHPRIRLVESSNPIASREGMVRAKLYEVGGRPTTCSSRRREAPQRFL